MRFYVLEWQAELDRARARLAAFVRAPAEQLVFVANATTATAIAVASTPLSAGDEILTTDHAYKACQHQLAAVATERGARVVTVKLPLPYDDDAAVDAIVQAASPRTRLALLDHVTSPTALVLPLARIVPALAARGVAVIVDGAHAPGQLDLDVSALLAAGATWYAGNNHRWLCAPKSSGFLVAGEDAPPPRPVVVSHGASIAYGPENRFHAQLDWMGSHDPTPHLCVPAAIDTVAELGGGWPAVFARNHALAIAMRDRLAAALAVQPLAPATATGSMAALPITLPAGARALDLEKQLLASGIELPIVNFVHGQLVRLSAHLYNDAAQADLAARALHELGVRGRQL
jgi:isopenicillin-N epimerase